MNKPQMKTFTQTKPAPALDRVGYPSGSSLNCAMKKYYNDIGSRLSEMPLTEQYTDNASEDLSPDFCMLTIDTRHLRSHKQRRHSADSGRVSRGESHSTGGNCAEVSTSESVKTASGATSNVSSPREPADCLRRKQRLLEKLTCSLFLKKHMCARCNKKSRSCISNKTFTGAEKRYMCFKCRDRSQTLKNIYDEHYNSKDSELSHSTSGQIFDSQSKENTIPMLRKNIKDSGYDTVTSCSTVASAYSAFSTPANTKHNIHKDNTTTKPVLYGDQALHSERNISTAKGTDRNTKCQPAAHKPCEYSTPNMNSRTIQDSDSELSDIISTSQPESEEEFRHPKQRTVNRFDVYLTQTDYNELEHKPRPILSDASNVDDVSGNGDTCYFPPRIIRVSQTGKNTTAASEKSCYTCDSTSKPCFRLPWEGGWICEDCLDGLH